MAGRVDIAIPCYNYGRFLPACVASALDSQGVEDIRLLIVDNASTDDSLEVARELAAKDSRIEVSAHVKNLGPHASFNEGIDWSSGDYFMVLCSDDLLTPGSLASMVSIMDRHPDASFAYGHDVEWHWSAPFPNYVKTPRRSGWDVCSGLEFIHERCAYPERLVSYGMVLARSSVQKAVGHYRPELPHSDDFEMLLRLACAGRVARTETVVGIRRIHQSNRSQQFLGERSGHIAERMQAFESFFRQEGRDLADADRLLGIAKSNLSGQAYWRGLKDIVRGRRSGFELLGLAVSLKPSAAIIPPFGYLSRMERPFAKAVLGLP